MSYIVVERCHGMQVEGTPDNFVGTIPPNSVPGNRAMTRQLSIAPSRRTAIASANRSTAELGAPGNGCELKDIPSISPRVVFLWELYADTLD